MEFDVDVIACAALVERADPARFRAVMAAPVAARAVLFPIYAFNVEVARAPWVTGEPMIAEMRLQWWRDALDEIGTGQGRRHEVATPLARVLAPGMAEILDKAVAARRWDIYREPFQDTGHFIEYIQATSGGLLWAAGASLGARDEAGLRARGAAIGMANWFLAVPQLREHGRLPLVDTGAEAVRDLARQALAQSKHPVELGSGSAPVLLAGWQAGSVLRQVIRDPKAVTEGRLRADGARARLGLMIRAAFRAG